jgi:hypothetical protein
MFKTKEEKFDELMNRFQDNASPETNWAMSMLRLTNYDDFNKLMNAWLTTVAPYPMQMGHPNRECTFKNRVCNDINLPKHLCCFPIEHEFVKSVTDLDLKEEHWVQFFFEMFHRLRRPPTQEPTQQPTQEPTQEPTPEALITQEETDMQPMQQHMQQHRQHLIVTKEDKYDTLMRQFQDNASPETNWAMRLLHTTNHEEFTKLMNIWTTTPSSTLPDFKTRVCDEMLNVAHEHEFINSVPPELNLKEEHWIPFFFEMFQRVRHPPTPQEMQEKMNRHMQQMQQMQEPQPTQ